MGAKLTVDPLLKTAAIIVDELLAILVGERGKGDVLWGG